MKLVGFSLKKGERLTELDMRVKKYFTFFKNVKLISEGSEKEDGKRRENNVHIVQEIHFNCIKFIQHTISGQINLQCK